MAERNSYKVSLKIIWNYVTIYKMKQLIKYSLILLITGFFLTSCSESRKNATEKLNEWNEQAEELNTAVDDGLKKVESLDSVVRSKTGKIREYDSLIKRSTSRIDSIAKEKAGAWEELTTF